VLCFPVKKESSSQDFGQMTSRVAPVILTNSSAFQRVTAINCCFDRAHPIAHRPQPTTALRLPLSLILLFMRSYSNGYSQFLWCKRSTPAKTGGEKGRGMLSFLSGLKTRIINATIERTIFLLLNPDTCGYMYNGELTRHFSRRRQKAELRKGL
jgi:hypothetical protein